MPISSKLMTRNGEKRDQLYMDEEMMQSILHVPLLNFIRKANTEKISQESSTSFLPDKR